MSLPSTVVKPLPLISKLPLRPIVQMTTIRMPFLKCTIKQVMKQEALYLQLNKSQVRKIIKVWKIFKIRMSCWV